MTDETNPHKPNCPVREYGGKCDCADISVLLRREDEMSSWTGDDGLFQRGADEIDRLRARIAELEGALRKGAANTLDLSAVPVGWEFGSIGRTSFEPDNLFQAFLHKKPGPGYMSACGPTPAAALALAIERAKEAGGG